MAEKNIVHSALGDLDYRDGVLQWGSIPVTELVERAGGTPFYAYDRERISASVQELRATLPETVSLHYAVKANPMPAVVSFMLGLVDGLDVASAGELQIALDAGANPATTSFAGPGKRSSELRLAIESRITIHIESPGELKRVMQIASELGEIAKIAIRVNPSFEFRSTGMKMGGRPSPFGIDAEAVPDVLGQIDDKSVDFLGFHVFSGSQSLRSDAICDAVDSTTELVLELAESAPKPPSYINMGGGLGIPYAAVDEPLMLGPFGAAVEQSSERLRSHFGDPTIIFELGRYLVGPSGVYVCRVIDVKESRGRRFAILDGGLHQNLAGTGNFGQILRRDYPIAAVHPTERKIPTTIVGPLCTPLDIFQDNAVFDELQPGALVAVLQSGAYGLSASPINFLSHPTCTEILV